MTLVQTLLAFLTAIGILVVVHELGHFLVARACNVKVIRFSFGFGKILWSRPFGNDRTEWAISAIPLGGYVAMLDEQELEPGDAVDETDLARAFNRQPLFKRAAIVVAGPVANLLLAIALYTMLGMAGQEEPVARLGPPLEASAAAQAGLQDGDRITSVNDKSVASWTDAHWQLLQAAQSDAPVDLVVERSGKAIDLRLHFAKGSMRDLDADFLEHQGLRLKFPRVLIAAVVPGSIADSSGLRVGDLALSVNDAKVLNAAQLRDQIRQNPGQSMRLVVERTGIAMQFDLVPQPFVETQGAASVGRIGVSIAPRLEMQRVQLGFMPACRAAVQRTWETAAFSLRMMGRMLQGEVSLKNLSGPVTIADYAGQTARIGIEAYVGFLALISISIGVLNLLPIPMLDGGHLLYYLIEFARGRPLSEGAIEVGRRAGFGILLALMAIALFNDATRLPQLIARLFA
jgi:regulator of sigma E protease